MPGPTRGARAMPSPGRAFTFRMRLDTGGQILRAGDMIISGTPGQSGHIMQEGRWWQ
jgi:hypothetical protein